MLKSNQFKSCVEIFFTREIKRWKSHRGASHQTSDRRALDVALTEQNNKIAV